MLFLDFNAYDNTEEITMLPLSAFIIGIKALGPVMAAIPDIQKIIHAAIGAIHPDDQESAKSAYTDLIVDNAEGYARLDEKLRLASEE